MKKLNFGIIGCGNIAQRHAEHIANFALLKAVCDVKPDRAARLAQKYACVSYTDVEELILSEKEIDVITVCTPNFLHAQHTILAFGEGKHVLCEKPMATTLQDAHDMILAAEKAKRNLFIVKQNRFNPPVVSLKNAIKQGKLGRIFSVQLNCFWNRTDEYYLSSDWKGKKNHDGGILFTQFSHFIDLLSWLVGDVEMVHAYGNNFMHPGVMEFEDTGVVIMKFCNGALGTINFTVNSYKNNMEGSITVFGEYGTVKVGGQYLNILEYQNIKDFKMSVIDKLQPANEYGFYQGSMSNHDKVYENVVSVLTGGGTIAATGTEGMKTVAIIEKIYHQLRKGAAKN